MNHVQKAMKITNLVLLSALFSATLSGCLDGGIGGGGGSGGTTTNPPNTLKNTKWNVAELVVSGAFLISSSNAASANLGLTIKATTYVLEEAAGDCNGAFTTDDTSVVDFKDATCTASCCSSTEFQALKTLLVSGVATYQYNTEKTQLTLRQDGDNYITLKKP